MKVKVEYFMTFRKVTGKKSEVIDFDREVNVYEVLSFIYSLYGDIFRGMLFDGGGNVKDYVKILLNGRDIRGLEGLKTVVREDSVISIFPPIGGGNEFYSLL